MSNREVTEPLYSRHVAGEVSLAVIKNMLSSPPGVPSLLRRGWFHSSRLRHAEIQSLRRCSSDNTGNGSGDDSASGRFQIPSSSNAPTGAITYRTAFFVLDLADSKLC